MALSLHHFYVLTEPDAPVAERLTELGMVEGSRNVHPGQGTANRRFFFNGAYLEFIFFVDKHEARIGPGSVFRSLDRFESGGGSPFGLVFKADNQDDIDAFPGFPYQPEYFDDGVFFTVGDNVDQLQEPNCFLLPIMPPAASAEPRSSDPFEQVTRLRVSVSPERLSPAMAVAASIDRVEIVAGQPELMEVFFGNGGAAADLRPDLPLIIRW